MDYVCNCNDITIPISENEVLEALNELNAKNSSGIDNLPASFWKPIKSIISKPLAHIFTEFLKYSFIPDQWKISKIIPF